MWGGEQEPDVSCVSSTELIKALNMPTTTTTTAYPQSTDGTETGNWSLVLEYFQSVKECS